jgi:transposase
VYWIGCDISKSWIDACALGDGRLCELRVSNDASGIRKLLKWALGFGEIDALGMESTGGYELDLAVTALGAGIRVSVENPRRIRDFARAMGYLNKTDRADARAIAEYLERIGASPWRLSDPLLRELSLLTRHRVFLLGQLGRAQNRLEHASSLPDCVVKQLREQESQLQKQLEQIDEARRNLVAASESLAKEKEALTRIVGIGETTAMLVLAEAGDVESFANAGAYAAYAGLNPVRRESGSWRGRTTISKVGSALLRSGLFLAASVASRHNPILKAFRERLIERGKTKMQALVACMRKLLMICYGVLKAVRSGKQPFYKAKHLTSQDSI